jgi:hypothetical protein
MPTLVTAKNGDCLCGIASDFGFFDCKPLRDLPENSTLLSRELRDGDQVTVPDLAVEDHPRAIDTKHTFKVKTSPPVNIRFVHGSPTLPYRDDTTTAVLNVSNFVTNLGGATGLLPFPTGFGFNVDGHDDPDTFKVEVWDPAAGASVNVKLEALKPVYTADPATGALTATSFVEFGDAQRRIDALVCNVVSAGTNNTYRSKYMRLVVDEVDRDEPSVAGQVLFVSDMADGLGTGAAGDNDSVEILDQMVRATYEVQRCTGAPKCKVSVVAPIGGDERQRVRLHFYIIRSDVGVETIPPAVPIATVKQQLRRRTFKWYRRVFAQANIAPKIVSMNVFDPPEENMLCLSHAHGNTSVSGNALTFDIETAAGAPIPFRLDLVDGETPLQVGTRVAGALPAGFTAEVTVTPRAPAAANAACDVIVTATSGDRVTITNPLIPPAGRMTVEVPRPVLTAVNSAPQDGSLSFLTTETKRYLHMAPVTDDALHCILVVGFSAATLLGRAYLPNLAVDPPFQPGLPFRSATIMAHTNALGGVLDGGDTFPMVSQHESTHILTDMVHTKTGSTNALNQLMAQFAQQNNAVDGPKRLCGGPFLVTLQQNTTLTAVDHNVRLVDLIRTSGAAKLEAW